MSMETETWSARARALKLMLVDWENWEPNMRATLLFIREGDQVLLIEKKRGFGKGKVNGPGGKLDPGETERDCAIRETQEELVVEALDPVKRGELWFHFADGMAMHVAVFMATQYTGTAIETEEAIPLWTPIESIPFDRMWADDRYWLHRMLTGNEQFLGKFFFRVEDMEWHDLRWWTE